jgi:hypothetical protein
MLGTASETVTLPNKALFVSGVVIGGNNTATGTVAATSVGIGASVVASGTTATALGPGASTAAYNSSTALGSNALCTSANQIMLGTATEKVTCPANLEVANHIRGITTAPTCTGVSGKAPLAVAGVTVVGTDIAGVVTFTTQGGAGRWTVDISFASSYGTAPVVVVSPGANNCKADMFVFSVTATTFTVDGDSLANAASGFTYVVIGR